MEPTAKWGMIVKDTAYIQVRGLNKFFPQKDGQSLHALSDINLSVGKGEIIVIVGASGCGKSTLLRAIAGLDPEHEGTVTIAGTEIVKPEKTRGIVFQEHRLFPWLTVAQNVGYAINGMPRREKKNLVGRYIDLVGLTGFEKAYPWQLSGGMAQRAGIARALVNNPSVLLLDEPFGALDTFTKIQLQKELKRIQQQSRTTMLLVTHDIEEAVYLADHVVILSSRPGRIKRIVHVELPSPRNRNSYEFMLIRKTIYDEFFEDEQLEVDYYI